MFDINLSPPPLVIVYPSFAWHLHSHPFCTLFGRFSSYSNVRRELSLSLSDLVPNPRGGVLDRVWVDMADLGLSL